jgi:short-subunit dehydrogenase
LYDPTGVKFHKADDDEILNTVTVNTFPMVFMTRFLGPDMKKRDKKSAVINMTSYYSDWPIPNVPIYSSAKSFGDVFSDTLSYEN